MMKKIIAVLVVAVLVSSSMNLSAQTDTLDYRTSPFQFTFLFPPFSTNGYDNVNYVNNTSINLFAGVSGGVDGVELGGFLNIDKLFVTGFQGAGFANVVGGNVDGVQLAGFLNANGGSTRYVQGAGFVNVTGVDQVGLQGAGFANVVGGNLFGFQGAGFSNIVGGNMQGIQGAGFINLAGDTVSGIQGAGFLNVAGKCEHAVQGAGFGNIAGPGTVHVQGSGFFNIAEDVRGVQATGFFNRAGYVKGVQAAGFLNICDSIDGVPIAFISIVKYNAYRKFEIAASETQYVNISYRMGVEKFYTIYSFGKLFGPGSRFIYGAGIGSQWGLSERSFINVEALAQHEVWFGDPDTPWFMHHSRYNMYSQLRFAFGWNLGNFADLFIGPTLNVSVANTNPLIDTYMPWTPISPNWAFFDRTYNNSRETNVAIWVGLRGGIRF